MNKDEFIKYVNQNNIDLDKYNIVVGEKSNTPYTIGCYVENSNWILYEVGERQNFSMLKRGNEQEIFQHLYYRVLARVSD